MTKEEMQNIANEAKNKINNNQIPEDEIPRIRNFIKYIEDGGILAEPTAKQLKDNLKKYNKPLEKKTTLEEKEEWDKHNYVQDASSIANFINVNKDFLDDNTIELLNNVIAILIDKDIDNKTKYDNYLKYLDICNLVYKNKLTAYIINYVPEDDSDISKRIYKLLTILNQVTDRKEFLKTKTLLEKELDNFAVMYPEIPKRK